MVDAAALEENTGMKIATDCKKKQLSNNETVLKINISISSYRHSNFVCIRLVLELKCVVVCVLKINE